MGPLQPLVGKWELGYYGRWMCWGVEFVYFEVEADTLMKLVN